MSDQKIAHLDMDSFYASVEIRDDPTLEGLPVVIGSDPREGQGRGVVSTCSYEARRYGLHSGMPISRAWQLCPHAVFIRPDKKYGEVSVRIMAILQELSGEVEQVSIDEAYMDFSGCESWEEARMLAEQIKKVIYAREKLTCSIGIAPARTYAKIASDLQKPDGLIVIPPGELHQVIDTLPAEKIPGVGKKSKMALESYGIRTIRDLAETDIQRLQDIFGSWAVRVREVAAGLDYSGLKKQGPQKSLGRETTFDHDISDSAVIMHQLILLAEDLGQELVQSRARCRTIGIRIRYTGFITQSRAISLLHSDDKEQIILKTALQLFEEFWTGEPVRLIGIRLSGLEYPDPVQRTLQHFLKI